MAPVLKAPFDRFCAGLKDVFDGVLSPLAASCTTLWDLRRWMPADGIGHSAFTDAPLEGQSVLSYHYYRPPQSGPSLYASLRGADAARLHTGSLLSETCCANGQMGDLRPTLYEFEQSQVGWVVWEYKTQTHPWSADYWLDSPRGTQYSKWGSDKTGSGPSMFYFNGAPIQDSWRTIAHPSAQYVRGVVHSNVFEYWHGRFNLTFEVPQVCKGAGDANSEQSHDAVILWPGAWWANKSFAAPTIEVFPPGAADILDVPWFSDRDASDVGFVRGDVDVSCRDYMLRDGCGWTSDYNCPAQPLGAIGAAREASGLGFQCCCAKGLWKLPAASPPRLTAFGVRLRPSARGVPVTVLLSLRSFAFEQPPPAAEVEELEPNIWWSGMAWPSVAFLAMFLVVVLLAIVCKLPFAIFRRCCVPLYRGAWRLLAAKKVSGPLITSLLAAGGR